MQRQIKFRLWDKSTSKMILSDETTQFVITLEGLIYETSNAEPHVITDVTANYELMQFTSHYDKNGKEIYEGDVLKHKYFKLQTIGEVKWSTIIACYLIVQSDEVQVMLRPKLEVLGNIWENPSWQEN